MSGRGRASDRDMLVEQGDMRRKTGHHIGFWILSAIAAALALVATGNFLANSGNGTYGNGMWAITGGFGSLLGANGQSSVDVFGSTELDGYAEAWLISVPCNIVASE